MSIGLDLHERLFASAAVAVANSTWLPGHFRGGKYVVHGHCEAARDSNPSEAATMLCTATARLRETNPNPDPNPNPKLDLAAWPLPGR